jgi:hypothetical protein
MSLGEFSGSIKVNSSTIYSQVTVGYVKWQSDTAFGIDEFNGARTYQSENPSSSSQSFSLSSELVASGYIIEKLRQESLDSANKNKTNDLDSNIFIVSTVKNGTGIKAETSEYFNDVSGIISPETAYNLRISPRRNIENWRQFLGGHGLMTIEGTEGNIDLVSTQLSGCGINNIPVREDSNFDTTGTVNWSKGEVVIEKDISPVYYQYIDRCVSFTFCGEEKSAIVKRVEYAPSKSGGKMTIIGWVI